jgi:hypothetical protein
MEMLHAGRVLILAGKFLRINFHVQRGSHYSDILDRYFERLISDRVLRSLLLESLLRNFAGTMNCRLLRTLLNTLLEILLKKVHRELLGRFQSIPLESLLESGTG